MANRFILNETSYHGAGAIKSIVDEAKGRSFKKAFVCSDPDLVKFGVTKKVLDVLDGAGLPYELYSNIKPNPTIENVQTGVEAFKASGADYIVAIGGGSSMDTAKAIGIIIKNPEFADVRSLEGVADTKNKAVPIFAVPTTAGTAAEVTINYVITDEERHVKMIMVDTNSLAAITVNDPELMLEKPAALTAATGMDALTHAIEAVVAKGAMDVTNCTALYAIKEIFDYLPTAVKNGHDVNAREQMCYSCFLNGIAFSNAGLGNVHAMAHQLGGLYDLPHGVCNAMLLPIVEEENAKHVPEKFRPIAKVIGLDTENKTDKECVDFVINKIKLLSEEVGIPKSLKEVGVDNPDFELLAENSMKDACAGANPVFFSKETLIELFKKIS